MIARVIVTPKPVVNDPQGITVKQGLATLGFREVSADEKKAVQDAAREATLFERKTIRDFSDKALGELK